MSSLLPLNLTDPGTCYSIGGPLSFSPSTCNPLAHCEKTSMILCQITPQPVRFPFLNPVMTSLLGQEPKDLDLPIYISNVSPSSGQSLLQYFSL